MDYRIYSQEFIDDLKQHFEKSASKYITYPQFIFLCGKGIDKNSPQPFSETNRGILQDYIKKLYGDVFIVLSEDLWQSEDLKDIDLLTFEEFLAEVSDYIVLFVESPGSFCELGAFVYADKLFSDKLLIVLDEQYKDSKSFINMGPISKATELESSVIYAPIENGALLGNSELRNKVLDMVALLKTRNASINRKYISFDSSKVLLTSFIIEIIELLRLVQPITQHDLLQLYKEIKEFDSFSFIKRDNSSFQREIKIGYIFRLLMRIGLICENGSMLTLSNPNNVQPLMFKYYGTAHDLTRNKLLCRKYRYGG